MVISILIKSVDKSSFFLVLFYKLYTIYGKLLKKCWFYWVFYQSM